MSVVIDGTSGITTPAETVQGALTTTGNTILGDASTDTLNVGNGGLVKDASGNVGIGTASPASYGKLVSLGADNATTFAAVGATNMLRVQGYNSTYVGTVLEAVNLAQSANTPLFINASQTQFGISGTERMRIDSSGNVGIGTASPSAKLNVVTSGGNSRISIGDTAVATYSTVLMYGGNGKYNFQLGAQANINNGFEITPSTATGGTTFSTPAFIVDSSGNVGIGTANPTQKLDVTGNATVSGTVTSTGLVTSGVRAHNGMYEASIRWSNDSPNAKTYKIAKFSSAYWGSGAYTIEVWKTYFDNFGYARYIISGHTFTAYSPAMSLVTVSTTGTVTPVSLSGIIAIDAQGGYVNLIVTNPSYGQGRIKITSPANLIQTTNANISHNECYIYPENTVV